MLPISLGKAFLTCPVDGECMENAWECFLPSVPRPEGCGEKLACDVPRDACPTGANLPDVTLKSSSSRV